MLDVVDRLGGLHAQVMSSAELTLWARVKGIGRNTVADALWVDRTLVKTWAMRGTLHIFSSDDFPIWQSALSTYRNYLRDSWLRNFGVSRDQMLALIDAVGNALDGEPLTREELAEACAVSTGRPELRELLRSGWGAHLKPVAYNGKLCFAPGEGQKVRFTRPDRWLANWRAADEAGAVAEVVRRYLSANAPATREALARWWGTDPPGARRLLERLGEEVVEVEVEGVRAHALHADLASMKRAQPARSVRLLPAFDQYVVAAPRKLPHLLPVEQHMRVYRSQGWFTPVLLVDGRMEGIWKHARKGKRLVVEIEPFAKPKASTKTGAEAEAAGLASFLGGELDLVWAGG